MKLITGLVLIFIIYSCRENNKPRDIDSKLADAITNSVADYSNILGQWSMCVESCVGQAVQYNVCPIITFNSNGSGTKITSSNKTENFTWVLRNKLLEITYVTETSYKTFPDTNYIVTFKEGSENNELEIRQEQKDCSFYLSRRH
jgi:hypothetical protein